MLVKVNKVIVIVFELYFIHFNSLAVTFIKSNEAVSLNVNLVAVLKLVSIDNIIILLLSSPSTL